MEGQPRMDANAKPGSRRAFGSLLETPAATVLAVLNAATFVALTAHADLEDTLGLSGGWDGFTARPWTPLTVMFTSGHVVHAVAAVAVLLLFGRVLERTAGSLHLVAVYLLAGLAGSVAFVLSAGADDTALGASAAFLGVLGAVAVTEPRSLGLDLPKILVAVLAVNLVLPLLGIGVWASSLAHAAGIAVGGGYFWQRKRHRARNG
jgi:membrane associated rhomboid family serine protease